MKLLREYIRELLVESDKAAEIRDHYGIDLWMKGPYGGNKYEPDIVEIESLVVPKEKRGKGIATDVMFELVRWADSNGYILALDPSSDFGSSVLRLRKFYSQFGFSGNKGRKKDYRTRYAMIRYPENKVLKEATSSVSLHRGSNDDYFRVNLSVDGRMVGYAEVNSTRRYSNCQENVMELEQSPEYIAAKEQHEATSKWSWSPKMYVTNNVWIPHEVDRGKGYGRLIYQAAIDQAIQYARSSGGVFIGSDACDSAGSTSADAGRVWSSLGQQFGASSGQLIFVRTN